MRLQSRAEPQHKSQRGNQIKSLRLMKPLHSQTQRNHNAPIAMLDQLQFSVADAEREKERERERKRERETRVGERENDRERVTERESL